MPLRRFIGAVAPHVAEGNKCKGLSCRTITLFLTMPPQSLAFDPLSFLILTFRGRQIATLRENCSKYEVSRPHRHRDSCESLYHRTLMVPQNVVALARRKFRPLQDVLAEDIILMAVIPDYPVTDKVEMSKELWPSVWKFVHAVTIALESGASAVASDDTTGSPDTGFPDMRTSTE